MKTVFFSDGCIMMDHSQARLRRAIKATLRVEPELKYCFAVETARRLGYI